ncbi:MAG: hypothetical protein B6U72_01105 [Candidatus Altiarchaeales archaeon ex4484_2]|nr:MAG: hypothetical protein B6U72_01105 [Candidatus Altiarchaeales archaeon ex4484_2]
MNLKTKIFIGAAIICITLTLLLVGGWFLLQSTYCTTIFDELADNSSTEYRSCSADYDCLPTGCGECLNKKGSDELRLAEGICATHLKCLLPTNCSCRNGICSTELNHRKQDKTTIATDKTEYNRGENITLIVRNNLDEKIEFHVIRLEHYNELLWKEIDDDIDCPCSAFCKKAQTRLSPGETREYIWNQVGDDCRKIPDGRYRFKVYWAIQDGLYEEWLKSHSNEFTIKNNPPKAGDCEKDSDCVAHFSQCDCQYHCVNKDAEIKECADECLMAKEHIAPDCLCVNNTCVETTRCNKLEEEINELIEEIKYCESDSDCVLDESTPLVCPFGCYLVRSKLFNDGEALSAVEEKIQEYQNKCLICLYSCPHPPEQEDIKCRSNKCVDTRFTGSTTNEKEKIINLFNTYLNAGKNCDINLSKSIITEKSKEIVHYTCSNMADEVKCYAGRDFEIHTKQDTAVLYLTPYSHKIENPIFFTKENSEWRIDLYKMSNGLIMVGSTCDSGWGWRDLRLRDEFCSYFPEGECPDK